MDGTGAVLREKLAIAFAPVHLEVIDESERHAGHAGARPEGETHFRVRIVSARFEGRTRIERQRMVYDVLSAELESRIHALSLSTLTPTEAADS